MKDTPFIPEFISHKKLNEFLSNSRKKQSQQNGEGNSVRSAEEKNQTFENLLTSWEELSKEVINNLHEIENHPTKGKNGKSFLALGAMEAHINMAIQALRASRID